MAEVNNWLDVRGGDSNVDRFSGPCHLQRDHRSKNGLRKEVMAPIWTCEF